MPDVPEYRHGYDTLPGPPPVGCNLTPEQAAGLEPIPRGRPEGAAMSDSENGHVSFDEFVRWATEHGVNVNECVRIAFTVDTVRATAVTDEPVRMEVTEYLRDDFGGRFIEDGVPAVATRVVALRRLPSPPGT